MLQFPELEKESFEIPVYLGVSYASNVDNYSQQGYFIFFLEKLKILRKFTAHPTNKCAWANQFYEVK